jgi:phosphoenolpyruvate phosphomutase
MDSQLAGAKLAPRQNGERPTARLRAMLRAPELAFLMGAHDGLSARIAEVEGFEAIWASGFSVSTALGLRDSDEASWSQLLSVVECMTEATSIPIVLDGDTGYGNFNTARRFVRKAERLGVAGVCFEDKLFPKMNSFVGDRHGLADVNEFSGKLRACKEEQQDPDFCLIARVESLIAGHGMEEALERAHAYSAAGADAIFIHSRRRDGEEIEEFARRWGTELPLVISPTTYVGTPTEAFERSGISAVIWANQNMRAAVAAMRRVCHKIHSTRSVKDTEDGLAPLAEVFELMRYDELEQESRRYLAPGAGAGAQDETVPRGPAGAA